MNGPVLVYQIGSLGDTLVSIPCFRAVRRHFKNREVRLLEARLKAGRVQPSDLLLREKLIDAVTTYEHSEAGGSFIDQVGALLAVRKSKPGTVVYVPPAQRPAHAVNRDRLFFKMAGAKELIGFHELDLAAFSQRGEDGYLPPMPHQARLRLDRLAMDGVPFEESDLTQPMLHPRLEDREDALDWLSVRRRHPDRPLLALGVSTAQQATRWPVDRFRLLGEQVLAEGSAEIVVVGGEAEQDLGRKLVEDWGDGIAAAGEFDVHAMAALLSLCQHYLGLDTGTTHLAAAVGCPVLALYSDHNQPGEWDPLGQRHQTIWHRVPCGGCRLPVCPKPDHPCMTGISVEQVLQALRARMAEG